MTPRERMIVEHVRDNLFEIAEWVVAFKRYPRWEIEGDMQTQAMSLSMALGIEAASDLPEENVSDPV